MSTTDGLVGDLRAQLARGQALVVVGAGVAVAASGGSPVASWTGLLESGVRWCEDYVPGLPATWADLVRGFVGLSDASSLLSAADAITERLGGRGGGEYRRWLREAVGAVKVADPSVPEALAALGVPVATTNYDGRPRQTIPGWGTVTWRDGARIQRVLRGDENAVLHLHGFWDDPESVVLGIRSYGAVLGDGAAQALQRAMASLRSLVLVGVGAGADDPNVGALRAWLASTFPGSEYRHFRLCRHDEVSVLAAEHAGERIVPVPYGARHDELAGFLRTLVPTPEPARVPPTPAMPSQLPAARPTLGRSEEVARAVTCLMAEPPVPMLILGAPGIGKTNLTLALLHHPELAERFGHRRFFVRCEGAVSAANVAAELTTVVGLVLVGVDPLGPVLAALGEAPVLVALDNAETPWEADTLATEELFAQLAAVPGVALVASLRGGERPGGPAWGAGVRLDPLGAADARRLFLSVAGERFDAPELGPLLAGMGGVPLAVELLGHAAEGEPDVAGLAARWRTERVRLLQKGTADHRLLSVAVSVEASWTGPLMTDDARRLLSLLGVFPDGLAHSDLVNLTGVAGRVAANMLRRRGLAFDEAERLRTHPPIRHHVAVAHPPLGEDMSRAAEHYTRLATDLGNRLGHAGGAEAASRLVAEMANLHVVVAGLLAAPEPAEGFDVVHSLRDFARFSGVDFAEMFDMALRAARGMADDARTASVLFDLGQVALARSDHDGAQARFDEALSLCRARGDVLGEANCIRGVGDIALARSDHDVARARFEEALSVYRRVGSVLGEANCTRRLGNIALARSDHDVARAHFEEALPLFRQVDSVLGMANCIKRLGDVAKLLSDHDGARACFEEALPLYRRVGSVLGEAGCLYGLGNIGLARLDHDGARACFEEALTLFRRVGSVLGEAGCIQSLGEVALACSDHERARHTFAEALSLYERIPEPYSIGDAHRRLARLAGSDEERNAVVAEARVAWESIGRDDLLAQLVAEFG